MAKLTDDADYDATETSENVPRPWSDFENDYVYNGLRTKMGCRESQQLTMDLVHSQTFRRHRSRHHQCVLPFSAPSYELAKAISEAPPSTNDLPKTVTLSLLFLSWSIYLLFTLFSHCRPITTSHLFTFYSSICVPFCGKSSAASSHLLLTPTLLCRSAYPTLASIPDPLIVS
ncbi:unnamed protein product [Protopolystoma xenopodis]|uniref:Uncharacterized protein n=1 Tax=Protopolystoma xenopodis TaxID=117903 RepID=A0A3S5ALT4_9PLAT|nr:unnamed protein product [Protopolystoma xenopodis]